MFNTYLYFQISENVTMLVLVWKLFSFRIRSLEFRYIHFSSSANFKFSTIYFSFPDIDECDSDPCKNGANCTDGVNNYTCTCMAGYGGPNCSIGKLDHFASYFTS